MPHNLHDIICVKPRYAKYQDRLTPTEFLKWARTDLKGSDRRSIGNALGNIKKSVHCRLDEIVDITHVAFCKDWDPYCNTETKLYILRQLGLPFSAIVSLITDIRNIYEHKYRLPTLAQVRAYCDVAELWLKDSTDKCNIGMISLVNVPLQLFGMSLVKKGNAFTKLVFSGMENVTFFWNPKKEIVCLDKCGRRSSEDMTTKPWKSMLQFEAPLIKKALKSSSKMTINQMSATYLFKSYERWLKRKCP